MTKVKTRRRVLYEFRDDRGTVTVEFVRIPKDLPAPAFSHRVYLTGYVGFIKDWLGDDFEPNGRSALFFYEKHTAQPAAPAQL